MIGRHEGARHRTVLAIRWERVVWEAVVLVVLGLPLGNLFEGSDAERSACIVAHQSPANAPPSNLSHRQR